MTDEKEKTDVSKIQELLDIVTDQADIIHKKASELHNRAAEPDSGKESEVAGDVGIRFKDALIRLQDIQRKTLLALDGFV